MPTAEIVHAACDDAAPGGAAEDFSFVDPYEDDGLFADTSILGALSLLATLALVILIGRAI